MILEKRECENISQVLSETQTALAQLNAFKLKELSNRTIHSACSFQDAGSITSAILVYSLAKLVERKDYKRLSNWNMFVKKCNSFLSLAVKAIDDNNQLMFEKYLEQARKVLESTSINLRPYIKDVLHKASINKGAKMHAHGISLEQTSQLLGITQWELAEYIGQRAKDEKHDYTIDTKKRVRRAMEFFS